MHDIRHKGNHAPEKRTEIDESLLIRLKNDDAEAFRALYEQASSAVFGYAFSVLKNYEAARDVMQDTFVKIRAAAHLYEPQGKPMAWIMTITRNLCNMKFRQNTRMAETEDLAQKYGITPGKVRLIQKAMEDNPDLNIDEPAQMPVNELVVYLYRSGFNLRPYSDEVEDLLEAHGFDDDPYEQYYEDEEQDDHIESDDDHGEESDGIDDDDDDDIDDDD